MKKPLILLLFALLTCVTLNGQAVPYPPPGIPTGPGLPIDSGISFLIIAGAAYGYKKLKSKK